METHQEKNATTDASTISIQQVATQPTPFQIGARLLEVGVHLFVHTLRFAGKLLWKRLSRNNISRKALLGQAAADLCNSLGATFIKIGQILSTRRDLLSPEVIAPLIKLQDDIAPIPFRFVPPIVLTQFGRPLTAIFQEFEERPISSASIASVYRARLLDGRVVAVKVRRPEIVTRVACDLFIMRVMARLMGRLKVFTLIPMLEMINEVGQYIERQVDLRIEASNNRRFRAQFAHEPLIQFPVLIEEYCTDAIIVMDFIEDLVRIDQLQWAETEYQQSLIIGLRALYQMIFVDGFVHCDLHPGNMYFCPGGRVIMLDTGFVAELNRQNRFQFTDFFLGIATNDGKKCARILYETAFSRTEPFDHDRFEQATVEIIAKSSGSQARTFQVAPFVAQIFDVQRRFGLRGSTNFTMAILSLLVFEGIAKQLYPHLDFQKEAKPFLYEVIFEKQAEIMARNREV
ncbi:ABC1 kinase family protein [Tengunoibacter tsumagoiensis]|uniref:Protein kinase domain-containing protein n=1 Tax=Tengunoibacter tsumagoiensis TaxID=2014871 RepID=A0A402A9F5_9CHLR|nr:AarF/UbiB family protein [Tengunoibacter tsumagoiensis]GCE15792.1 putative protein kinase UbiB [Tengunoibacter tsumagoiensis]